MAIGFKDHFSGNASEYSRHRPTYPSELVEFLADISPRHDLAWDCGCGTGQLSVLLAERFKRVIAMDASAHMIDRATLRPNIDYRCMRAEDSDLPEEFVDLAVAAQAVHWFDLSAFYNEVWRVTRPGGIIALVTYGLESIDDEIDPIVRHFYSDVLNPYWPPERKLVEEGYRSLPFPFKELNAPKLEMRVSWSLGDLLGYIDTWSAVRGLERARGRNGREQVEEFQRKLAQVWQSGPETRTVRWPLAMRVGRV